MCGFYDDEQKIKKGDKAIFKSKDITIIPAKHIKHNRTMDITYQTSGYGFKLLNRDK
jgi:hypothetical protein